MKALVLIAHGSRRREANADLDYIAEGVHTRGGFDIIRTAYLELAEPTIPDAVAASVEAGATSVMLMPYFLSPGIHVTEDLEQARGEFAITFPKVTFEVAQPLGRHPLLIEIVLERVGLASRG